MNYSTKQRFIVTGNDHLPAHMFDKDEIVTYVGPGYTGGSLYVVNKDGLEQYVNIKDLVQIGGNHTDEK